MQTECRFSLSVMCDNYVERILGALEQVDLDQMWSRTDALSTTYHGERQHVLDAVQAFFDHANDGETHITMEATFTACPDDLVGANSVRPRTGRTDTVGADIIRPPTEQTGTVGAAICRPRTRNARPYEVRSKIAFYPLGIANYADHIAHTIEFAQQHGLYQAPSRYGAELFGDVQALFDYFDAILAYAEAQLEYYALQVTLSVNSPTKQS